ncbi:hypothetical protein [Williamsia sp. D3]|uniref:hypothetical protein n=1 Tax=Williamsia sp. D3 TaxID=1313067 RepID=UPI0003D2D470|nr:hypothetical protein [Williamsia sp. D3]ETD30191.1 hypothetical protein W823_26445 [Williamsia sp. D3]
MDTKSSAGHPTHIDAREDPSHRTPITGDAVVIECSTGRSGSGRAESVSSASWEGSLPTGRGHVAYVVTQKIGALAFMPMMNPQSSTCRGAATV